MFHLTEAPLCDVHASYGGARDEHHTQRPLPDHRLVNSRVGQCLTYRQHAHQGGAANEGGITQAQQVAHIVGKVLAQFGIPFEGGMRWNGNK